MLCGRRLHAVLVMRRLSCDLMHWWYFCGQEGAAPGQKLCNGSARSILDLLIAQDHGSWKTCWNCWGHALNEGMVVMFKELKIFELYARLGYRMILVLFVCVEYVSSLGIVVSVLRSSTGDDGLLGPLGLVNGCSSTGMDEELR